MSFYVVRIPAADLVKGDGRFPWFDDEVRRAQGRPIVGELAQEVDEDGQPTGFYLMSKGIAEDHLALELAVKGDRVKAAEVLRAEKAKPAGDIGKALRAEAVKANLDVGSFDPVDVSPVDVAAEVRR